MRRHFLKKFSSAAEQAAESEDLMEFFNSAVDTLQTIVVGLGGALCVWAALTCWRATDRITPAAMLMCHKVTLHNQMTAAHYSDL